MNTDLSEEFSASNDHAVFKRKRTKRHRPSAVDSNSSPSTTEIASTNTEEDEDLANCLILLARGRLRPQSTRRKFAEDAYECKTCSRTFASFQALGGHRTSHRKPNSAAELLDRKIRSPPPPEEAKLGKFDTIVDTPPPPIKLQMSKIHECSICGSEFASGQALGGHMRRHRSPPPSAAARSGDDSDSSDHDHRHRNVFSLDLNLPAPPEEFSKPRLIFAAVVDCHY
ncbi:zinc finger protein ZAT5-like [Salvia hispanica]|uniref:zinc finger protein ZAT5-like n=1 Tax=Salvia hispanica TaxID=49212 RepID=UPI002008F4D8|nr:zinc finger protein ZAT5-like [Salvia hispanica]